MISLYLLRAVMFTCELVWGVPVVLVSRDEIC